MAIASVSKFTVISDRFADILRFLPNQAVAAIAKLAFIAAPINNNRLCTVTLLR